MTRSQTGDQISAHISKSSSYGDLRALMAIVYQVDDAGRRKAFEATVKKAYSEDGCGYWHAMPNMILVKIPQENEGSTGCSVHFRLLPNLNQAADQLAVLGPLWEVDSDDWGLDIDDAVNFGRALA